MKFGGSELEHLSLFQFSVSRVLGHAAPHFPILGLCSHATERTRTRTTATAKEHRFERRTYKRNKSTANKKQNTAGKFGGGGGRQKFNRCASTSYV